MWTMSHTQEIKLGSVKCAVHYPSQHGPFPVVLFLHGQGSIGKNYHNGIIHQIASSGFVVVSIEQDRFRTMTAKKATEYVNRLVVALKAANLPDAYQAVGLCGHSLGGSMCLRWAASEYAKDNPHVKAVVTIHGPFNLTGNFTDIGKIKMPIGILGAEKGPPMAAPKQNLRTFEGVSSMKKVYIHVGGARHKSPTDAHKDVGTTQAACLCLSAWVQGSEAAEGLIYEGMDTVVPDLIGYCSDRQPEGWHADRRGCIVC